jgi:hypothetical protein
MAKIRKPQMGVHLHVILLLCTELWIGTFTGSLSRGNHPVFTYIAFTGLLGSYKSVRTCNVVE